MVRINQSAQGSARLFFGIDVGDAARSEIQGIISRVSTNSGIKDLKIRWTAPENLHVTLKFLGDTRTDAIPAIRQAAASVLAGARARPCILDAWGSFPSGKGTGVLWASVTGDLRSLAGELDASLELEGFKREQKPFVGHLTLARSRDARGLRAALKVLSRLTLNVSFQATAVTLFASELTPAGPVYRALGRWELNEPSVEL